MKLELLDMHSQAMLGNESGTAALTSGWPGVALRLGSELAAQVQTGAAEAHLSALEQGAIVVA